MRPMKNLLAKIPFRMVSTLYLLVPAVICVLFGILIHPSSGLVQSDGAALGCISILCFVLAALILALALLRPLRTGVNVYEEGLELRSLFRTRVLLPEEIEYLRTGRLRESPLVGKPTLFQYSMEKRRDFICIKPRNEKELCLTYKSYGPDLEILLDWQWAHQIPDDNGVLRKPEEND